MLSDYLLDLTTTTIWLEKPLFDSKQHWRANEIKAESVHSSRRPVHPCLLGYFLMRKKFWTFVICLELIAICIYLVWVCTESQRNQLTGNIFYSFILPYWETQPLFFTVMRWFCISLLMTVPVLFLLVDVSIGPETPRWLLGQNRREEAYASLFRLRQTSMEQV